jgi:chromate transporter
VLGLCLVPVALILALGFLYFTFKEVPAVKGALHGASAAAVALTVTMVIKTGQKCLTGVVPVAFFAAAFILNGVLRWPLLLVLGILAPLALIWAWPRERAVG